MQNNFWEILLSVFFSQYYQREAFNYVLSFHIDYDIVNIFTSKI